jgi:hypothetical protein
MHLPYAIRMDSVRQWISLYFWGFDQWYVGIGHRFEVLSFTQFSHVGISNLVVDFLQGYFDQYPCIIGFDQCCDRSYQGC